MLDRRDVLKAAASAAVLANLPVAMAATKSAPVNELIHRAIPSSGERIPVIGVGTNNYSPATPEERTARREVIEQLTVLGASVIDTAPAYRQSETTLGELLAEIGNRKRAFVATKVTAQSGTREEAVAMLVQSRKALRTDFFELVQVHNLTGAAVALPLLREEVAAKRVRYVGITTSRAEQYPAMLALMKSEPLDFIQVDYSIANRSAAAEILPLAQERKIAVLINMPFGGRRDGNLFPRVKDRPLPDFAKDIDATSWSQVFLKYVVGHPAVTCAIPGTTKAANLTDNIGAARGRLPDAALRKQMEEYWDREFAAEAAG
jgi:aryl-alcohol dehydrogenase-like predicted oxidoreductase